MSTAGHPNYGDELIARAWLEYLARRRPDEEVWFDCPHPGTAAVLFEGVNPNAHFTDTLWRLCWQTPLDDDPRAFVESVRRGISESGTPLIDAGLEKLWEADSVHLLGGGYVNNLWPHHGGLLAAMSELKRATGASAFATGLSLVPMLSAPELIAPLDDFDYVSVRDRPSSTVPGTRFGLDDGFLGVDRELRRAQDHSDVPDVVICIQNDLAQPENHASAIEFARETIEKARRDGRTVQYVEALPGSDRVAYERLRDVLAEEEFRPFMDVWRNGLSVGPEQFWVTTRFHLHFVAAAAGARGAAFDIHTGYYDVKHEVLRALGTGWANGADGATTTFDGINRLHTQVPSFIAEKQSEADSLYSAPPVVKPTTLPRPGLARAFYSSRLSRWAPLRDGWRARQPGP